jgi:hypothetical protein
MDSAIHLALAHPHEVLEYAIGMLKDNRGMTRQQAIEYIATNHANCRHSRECPWMPPAFVEMDGTIKYATK